VRILLVEDDAALSALVIEALAEEGHATTRVQGPDAACALAESLDWDLFIVDGFGDSMVHPDQTYCATLKRLSRRAPVLVTSGRAWAQHTSAEDLGAQALLFKPYDLDQLTGHVAALGSTRG
jgi:DNA-binding response OmpR family regulator